MKRKAASGAGRQRMVCSHMTADAEQLPRKGIACRAKKAGQGQEQRLGALNLAMKRIVESKEK